MARHLSSRSASPAQRPAKKPKLSHLTSEDFKNGIFLAPMVRSGAFSDPVPTRLFALKHGATLVWGPEMVDRAILHAERVTDPVTGVVSYNGKSRAMFTTHPIEKPYLIYQIGSSDPDLAVQAAKTVMNDVSGIDLNCGCPKPFSTHSGMGAALLTNPTFYMPPEITVSAKIRLLPSREDTLKLVERIVNTGISALTPAMVERLREIVDFVEGMGRGVAVIENGDCTGWENAKRIRALTGAHSVMVARAAESNPSCFSSTPLQDVERTLVPSYIRLAEYLDNHWGLTKFCVNQFHGTHVDVRKADAKALRQALSKSKSYTDSVLKESIGDDVSGKEEFDKIVKAIEARECGPRRLLLPNETVVTVVPSAPVSQDKLTHGEPADLDGSIITPPGTQNPDPPSSNAPKMPVNDRLAYIPALVSGIDRRLPRLVAISEAEWSSDSGLSFCDTKLECDLYGTRGSSSLLFLHTHKPTP
ncbi:tRNA-dihydrouridine(20) synthase [Salix suchowensis]|nr:tRNA-dihydrouridine(20) synthase [Salix suchowensis]